MAAKHTLLLLKKPVALVRYPPNVDYDISVRGDFLAMVRTPDEVTFVVEYSLIPEERNGMRVQKGFRVLQVKGPFALDTIGVLAALAVPLAKAKVSIFAISTWDTDYILVREAQLEQAVQALRGAGHGVNSYRQPSKKA